MPEQTPTVRFGLVSHEDVARLIATTPHSRKLSVINLDGQDYVARHKTERAARPFAILPLWQVLPVLDFILFDE